MIARGVIAFGIGTLYAVKIENFFCWFGALTIQGGANMRELFYRGCNEERPSPRPDERTIMRADRTLALAVEFGLALTAGLSGRAADAEETFRWLHIMATDALVLAADLRLHMGADGTVELWLAVAGQQDVVQPAEGERGPCIAQHGDEESDLVWRLSLTPDANGLIFTSERATSDFRQHLQLAGGTEMHLAFVTAGGRTQLILDGRHVAELDPDGLPQPGIAVDYQPALPEGSFEIEVVKELKTTTQWADAIRLDFEDDRP